MALQKNPLLTEKVVDMLLEQLKNNFNNYCSDIDNYYSDGISLEKIDENAYYITNQYEPLRMPSIFVLFEDHAFQYSRDPNYLESSDSCIVVVTSEDVGAATLTRKMWRYGRVLYSCLNLVDLVSGDGRLKLKVIPNRLGYTQPITEKLKERGRKFRMDAVLELTIQHYEKFLI